MTRLLLDPRTWFVMAAIMLCLALCSCADTLPCNEACTPKMWAAQETLEVEPVAYNDVFGKEWVAGVSVEGQTAIQHYARRK